MPASGRNVRARSSESGRVRRERMHQAISSMHSMPARPCWMLLSHMAHHVGLWQSGGARATRQGALPRTYDAVRVSLAPHSRRSTRADLSSDGRLKKRPRAREPRAAPPMLRGWACPSSTPLQTPFPRRWAATNGAGSKLGRSPHRSSRDGCRAREGFAQGAPPSPELRGARRRTRSARAAALRLCLHHAWRLPVNHMTRSTTMMRPAGDQPAYP